MNKWEKEDYARLKQQELSGNCMTMDGLRLICRANDFDPEKIGRHFLECLARYKRKGEARIGFEFRSDN